MASFGLNLDSPLLPNVDAYINPNKDEDTHRSALNDVVLNIHRAGAGAFEGLVSDHLGEYISNPDSKVRERATLLLAELLTRLPKLPLPPAAAARFAVFFSSRLGDYPSVIPSLKALSGLIKNHGPALLVDVQDEPTTAPKPVASPNTPGNHAGRSAGVIARGVFEELHLPALSQSVRQAALSVLRALVKDRSMMEAVSTDMGEEFVTGLLQSLEGEKDPRCLIVGISAIRFVQQGFDAAVLEATCEAVFDATACYFPVTFTPPPNDPHNISPDALKKGLEEVLVGSRGMARHVLPMLMDKLSSEVSTAKEASLKALVAGVRAFGAPGVGLHLRGIGEAMFEEVVHAADPDLASLALLSLMEVVRETAAHAEITGLAEACPEWRLLARPLLERAIGEVGGDQPCSVLGRGSARVLQALAASSALGLRCALAMAVPRLLRARAEAAAASAASMDAVVDAHGVDTTSDNVSPSASGGAATTTLSDAEEDAQTARLGVLAGLVAAVDSKVDFSGRRGGAPLKPFVAPLLAELSAALKGKPTGNSAASTAIAARGLSDLVCRPPVALVGDDEVATVIDSLTAVVLAPEALRDDGIAGGSGGEFALWETGGGGLGGVGDGGKEPAASGRRNTASFSALLGLRAIGLRRSEYARIVRETTVTRLLEPLSSIGSSSSTSGIETAGHDRASSRPQADNPRLERSLSAMVELSEIEGVFAVVTSAMLEEAILTTGGTTGNADKPVLRYTRASELSLRALDVALKRSVKWGHDAEILAFIHGAPPSVSPVSAAVNAADDIATSLRSPSSRGLPLLLAALSASSLAMPSSSSDMARSSTMMNDGSAVSENLAVSAEKPSAGSLEALSSGRGAGDSGGGGRDRPGLSRSALAAVVSVMRTCTRASPADDQEALLASLLSSLLPPNPSGSTDSATGVNSAPADGNSGKVGNDAMLPVLAAVMGAVSLESRVFGSGGAAVGAVPALLAAALVERGAGMVTEGGTGQETSSVPSTAGEGEGTEGKFKGDGGVSGGGNAATVAPCCQCLAVVLNKLAPGDELDSSVELVVDALTKGFARDDVGDAMDVEANEDGGVEVEGVGDGEGEGETGPVQCLAWTLKAVAMRGGLGGTFSALSDLLCGLLVASPSSVRSGSNHAASDDPRPQNARALAAAAAFGIVLGDGGEALRADSESGGARVSPLWRQRFFVQTFPRLLAASKGRDSTRSSNGRIRVGSPSETVRGGDEATEINQRKEDDAGSFGQPRGKGDPNDRVPPLLALLHVVRGVPSEALNQELDTVVTSVVRALGSTYPPLQNAALGTFQVLSRDFLNSFSQHLSSLIPSLLSLAEGRGGTRGTTDVSGDSSIRRQTNGQTPFKERTGGAMNRFRAVQCLTTVTGLPYSRLHPFKTQVTRRLRAPLDDDRRAIRQAAAKARNVWFLLG